MKGFKKWFLVVFILVLAIGWNIRCDVGLGGYSEKKEAEQRIKIIESAIEVETEPIERLQSSLIIKGCVDEDCVNKFLDKILDKLLQKVLMIKKGNSLFGGSEYTTGKYYITGISLSDRTGYWTGKDSIIVGLPLLLIAQNEAEISAAIAHEVGHCALQYIWPQSILQPNPNSEKDDLEEDKLADRIGIILMSKAGYDTTSAVDIMQRIAKKVGNAKYVKKRINPLYKNAKKYFKETQRKWILFSPEDLEKIKSFCEIHKQLNGE